MPNIKNNAATQETCRKLLNAAGETFAIKGLHASTIKEITELAGVNMAAVNYHFKDKFELYDAVVHDCYRATIATLKEIPIPEGTAEQRLRKHIENMLRHMLAPNRPAWEPALISREIANPCSKFGNQIIADLQQHSTQLLIILRDLMGHDIPEDKLAVAFCGIVGQCLFYLQQTAFIHHVFAHVKQLDSIPTLADRITELAIHGLCRNP